MGRLARLVYNSPFVVSIARMLDIYGTMNVPSPYARFRSAGEADAAAFARDWRAVGADLAHVMEHFREEELAGQA